jgi:hypothetical protein
MPVTVNTNHVPGKSIQDIYTQFVNTSTDALSKERGNDMLAVIEMLNSVFSNTQIWALTSHYDLILQQQDDWKAEWYVKINSLGNDFCIEYLLPENKRPWKYAYVVGRVKGQNEAKKYILIAMKECGAWEDNFELINELSNIQ